MILETILTWAVVTLSSSFMRSAPDYESSLENQMLMGALVETLDTDRYWVKVKAEDYTGWVTDLGLKYLSDAEKEAYLRAPKWICVTDFTRIREEPSERSGALSDLIMGDLLRQTGCEEGGWTQVLLPDGRKGWVLSHELMDFRLWAESRSGTALGAASDETDRAFCAREICGLACSLAGVPYMWGGNTVKHFDCSGLVKFCYFMNGILLPRNASQQVKCGTPVAGGEYKPGDLLFFGSRKPLRITHVAIYIGDGRIVHSSHSVRIMSLGDYARDVVAATRILSDIDKGKGAGTVLGSPYYFEQNGE